MSSAALFDACKDGDVERVFAELSRPGAGGLVNCKDAAYVRQLTAQHLVAESAAQFGTTPLHYAAAGGHDDVVRALIKFGADARVTDAGGWSALHWACERGHTSICELLLSAGAEACASNRVGVTSLHSAAERGAEACAILLLRAGAHAGASNSVGDTPLHWAAEKGHSALARALLEAGASPCALNQFGSSPLHAAAAGGHATLSAELVAAGADPGVQDANGCTPVDLARDEETQRALAGKLLEVAVEPEEDAELTAARQRRLARETAAAERRLASTVAQPFPEPQRGSSGRATPSFSPGSQSSAPAAEFNHQSREHAAESTEAGASAAAECAAAANAERMLHLSAIAPAVSAVPAALRVVGDAGTLAQLLCLLRQAQTVEAQGALCGSHASNLAESGHRVEASRSAVLAARRAVQAAVASGSGANVATAVLARDAATDVLQRALRTEEAAAKELAAVHQSRASTSASLFDGASKLGILVRQTSSAPWEHAGSAFAAAAAVAALDLAASSLVPAASRSAAAAKALLAALAEETEAAAALSDTVSAALTATRAAAEAAIAAAASETAGMDAVQCGRAAALAADELRQLSALEAAHNVAAAAALQLDGVLEAETDARLAAEELASEARKASLRGSWPPGRSAAQHAADTQQCAAMLRAYIADARRLRLELARGAAAEVYPELAGHLDVQLEGPHEHAEECTALRAAWPAAVAAAAATAGRSAFEVQETLRRTDAAALLAVALPSTHLSMPCPPLALKIIHRGDRLEKGEAALLTQLCHPRLAHVLAVFEDSPDTLGIMTQLRSAGNVGPWMEAHKTAARGMLYVAAGADWVTARRIVRQVLQALAYCHSCGVTHGAVKPSNLLWADVSGGDVLLADAGCASAHGVGSWAGPPEEAAAWGGAGASSDVWAAGLLALELATGTDIAWQPLRGCLECCRPDISSPVAVTDALLGACPAATTLGALGQTCAQPLAAQRPTPHVALLLPSNLSVADGRSADGTPGGRIARIALALSSAASAARGAAAARGLVLPLHCGSRAGALPQVLAALEEAGADMLAAPWATSLGGASMPEAQLVHIVLCAAVAPGAGLFERAPGGSRGGPLLPTPDDTPDVSFLGMSRLRALRALGRLLFCCAAVGIVPEPLELALPAFTAMLSPAECASSLDDSLARLRAWAPNDARALQLALCRRQADAPWPSWLPPLPQSDGDKVACAAAAAERALVGCRSKGLAQLVAGWADARDAVPGAAAALQQLRSAGELAMLCWVADSRICASTLRDAMQFSVEWHMDAPAGACRALLAWLATASDLPCGLVSIACSLRVRLHGSLLVVPTDDSVAGVGPHTLYLPRSCQSAADVGTALAGIID